MNKRQMALINRLIPVTRYDDLEKWAADFFAENSPIKLMIVLGPPGRQKSTIFEKYRKPGQLYLKGHVKAFRLYQELFHHRDEIAFFDDADEALEDKQTRTLVKNVSETRENSNEVMWTTGAARQLEAEGIPARFTTASRVLIIINDIEAGVSALGPVLSRATALWVNPTAEEVHRRVMAGHWYKDQEILDFVGEFIGAITDPDMRVIYRAAEQHKKLGRDWRDYLLQQFFRDDKSMRIAATVGLDTSLQTELQRIERFEQLGGGSRATYFRRKQELGQLMSDHPGGLRQEPATSPAASDKEEILRPAATVLTA
jgi:hypothetical protein